MQRAWTLALAAGLLWSADGAAQNGERARLRPVPELDRNVRTGPAVGRRIPKFAVTDQNGHKQTFETIRGPKGALLLFVRSADW